MSNERLAKDQAFKSIKENATWLAKENNKEYSLKLADYKKEQKMVRTTISQNDSLSRLKQENLVSALPGEVNRWADDKSKQDRFNQWLTNLRKDIYLDQAVKVVGDMISQQNLARGKEEAPKKAF